ncbi:toll-like receptor 13 [Mytilus trossulus]|uniref:toll-like receptor 13 n=1 Tax=Mytilus trossulus TaxID=6551 RepID=UPI0030044A12
MKKTNKMRCVAIGCILFLLSTCNSLLHSEICPRTIACTCVKETAEASCIRANLTYIPVLPTYIKKLDFDRNFLKSISVSTFEPLEHLELIFLSLSSCHITHINDDSFTRLKYVLDLNLSRNPLSSRIVAAALARISSVHFHTIRLNYLLWSDEPTDVYLSLSRFNIRRLDMYINNLTHLNMSFLSENLPQLETFLVGGGMISSIQTGFFPNLKLLDLNTNRINIGRKFFVNDMMCFFPNLKRLNLMYNLIMSVNNIFKCLKTLEILSLGGNPFNEILDNTFSELISLKYLHLGFLRKNFRRIGKQAFRNSKLENLNFGDNNFKFTNDSLYQFDPNEIFRYNPQMKSLILNRNVFQSTPILRKMLLPLKRLKFLYLDECHIQNIPTDLFFKLPYLEIVSMKHNKISTWNGYKVFGNETAIHTLMLSDNTISVVNEILFPMTSLRNLRTFSLASNPFACTCENLWFRNWLRNKNFVFEDFPSNYQCKTPLSKTGRLIKDSLPSSVECNRKDNEVFTAVVTSLSVFGIVFVIVLSIVFRLRWHIRYWLYLFRVKKKGFALISNEETQNYIYEGYVIYCDEDITWIRHKLLDKIEKEASLPLCIRDRNFEAGKVFVDNIIEKMSESRRVILVISRDMVQSNWCLFECRVAQEKFLNRESDALISLVVEDVPKEEMTSSLRAFVNSAVYMKFPKKEYDEETFWLNLTKIFHEREK